MGRPVGISSNGEEGDGTGQRASGRGDGTLASSVDPNRKQWRCTGDPQAVPSQEGRLASLPWGDSHWGRASSLWPQVIPRRGSAESWPPHSLADGERSPSILKGRLRAALMAPTAGGAPRLGLGLACSVSEYCPFGGELGGLARRCWLYSVLWVRFGAGKDTPLGSSHLYSCICWGSVGWVGGLGLGLPTPVSPAPGKWCGGEE